MSRKTQGSGRPSVPVFLPKGLAYSPELAIGTILVAVLLVLLVGFCLATTMPLTEREMAPASVPETISTPQGGGGNGGMTLRQALKRAL